VRDGAGVDDRPRAVQRPTGVGLSVQPPTAAAAGSFAARTITRHNDETHAQAIALVEELCAMNRGAGVPHRERRDDPRPVTAEV
jgi:hypothetical protein